MTDERRAELCAQWTAILLKGGLDVLSAEIAAVEIVRRSLFIDELHDTLLCGVAPERVADLSAELMRHCDDFKTFVTQTVFPAPGSAHHN